MLPEVAEKLVDMTLPKARFALAMIKDMSPENLLAIAEELSEDYGSAVFIASNWPRDTEVLALKQRIIDETPGGEIGIKYSKEVRLEKLWKIAKHDAASAGEQVSAIRVMNEMIEGKNGISVNINQDNSVKVLVVKDFGDADNWEKVASKQQRSIIDAGSS